VCVCVCVSSGGGDAEGADDQFHGARHRNDRQQHLLDA